MKHEIKVKMYSNTKVRTERFMFLSIAYEFANSYKKLYDYIEILLNGHTIKEYKGGK